MTNHSIVLFMLLMISSAFTQTYGQENIVVSGGNMSSSSGSVSFSVGQVFYQYKSSQSNSQSEGVQQPYEIQVVTSTFNQDSDTDIDIIVFPNAVEDELNIKSNKINQSLLNYVLYSEKGVMIKNGAFLKETSISMENLSSGTYMLNVQLKNHKNKTFKIIKN